MPTPDEWYLQHIKIVVNRAILSAVGDALRDMANDLTAMGVADDVVDHVRNKAALADGIRVVRVKHNA